MSHRINVLNLLAQSSSRRHRLGGLGGELPRVHQSKSSQHSYFLRQVLSHWTDFLSFFFFFLYYLFLFSWKAGVWTSNVTWCNVMDRWWSTKLPPLKRWKENIGTVVVLHNKLTIVRFRKMQHYLYFRKFSRIIVRPSTGKTECAVCRGSSVSQLYL